MATRAGTKKATRATKPRKPAVENALIQRTPGKQAATRVWGSTRHAGVYVTPDSALTFSAVWAACRIIAETVAMLSWTVQRELPKGGSERLVKDPLYRVLKKRANPEMTAFTWRQVAVFHALLWGNSYSEIERNGMGDTVALWPMLPDRTTPIRQGRSIVYEYKLGDGQTVILPAAAVLHVRGFSFDGVMGMDPISYMARSAAMGVAIDSFQASFFANGTHVSGGLFHPKTLSTEARDRLRADFETVYRGPSNAFKLGVFEEGLEWKSFQISPEAAQMIEAKKITIGDLCRFFRIQPHKLADLDRATFSNIEELNIDFGGDTIQPWVTRLEQEMDAKLIPARFPDRFCRGDMRTLLRGKQKDRYDAYHVGRQDGWLNANDIRAWEDLPPLPAEIGDVYWMPVNMQPAQFALDPPEPKPVPGAKPGDGGQDPEDDPPAPGKPKPAAPPVEDALGPMFERAWARIVRRTDARIRQLEEAGATMDECQKRAEEFIPQHREFVDDELVPLATAALSISRFGIEDAEKKARRVAETVGDWYLGVAGRCMAVCKRSEEEPLVAHWVETFKKELVEVIANA
jgi:HK97 family phage portal protein